jgi:phenylalanyl-tRNA synthetase beta chain
LAQLVLELAGGRVVGSQKVLHPSRDLSQRRIFVPEGYFSNFLGMDISDVQAEVVLRGLDCKVEGRTVVPPSYRLDLSIKEDLAEEVARSVGYDKIPATIPVLTSAPSAKTVLLDRAKNAFAQAGLQETINFAFTSASWLKQLGMESATRVLNPLSEEHEMLVPSLLPGLVRNALDNWRHHFGSESLAIRLFELRPTFHAKEKIEAKGDGKVQTETGVEEKWKLGMALAGPRFASGLRQDLVEIDFSDVKAVVELFFEQMGTRGVRFLPLSASRNQDHPVAKLLHPGQAVEVLAGNISAGFFGMMHPAKTKELKAKGTLWLGELDWDAVVKLSRGAGETRKFKSWPSFPPMERDFAIVVKNEVTADKITQIATKIGKPLAKVVKVFDIYRGGSIAEGMTSVAVRVIFYDEGRSLQESETEAVSARIVEAWKKELGAELRS